MALFKQAVDDRDASGRASRRVAWVAFQQAHHNFYRAAQFGLGAELAWPLGPGARAGTLPAAELVRQLLPAAR